MCLQARLHCNIGCFLSKRSSCLPLGRIQAALAHLKRFGQQVEVASLRSPMELGPALGRGTRVLPGDPAPIARGFPRQPLQHIRGLQQHHHIKMLR